MSLLPPKPGDERPQIASRSSRSSGASRSGPSSRRSSRPCAASTRPLVTGEDGRRALDVAIQVLESIRRHAKKAG